MDADNQEARRKESRFFPMSAFLATPSTSLQRIPARNMGRLVLDRELSTEKPLSSLPSEYVHDTVASAASRALAKIAAPEHTIEFPTHTVAPSSSNQQPSTFQSSKMAVSSPSTECQPTLLPISSPHIASPRLTVTPMDSASSMNNSSTINLSKPIRVSLPEPPSPSVGTLVTSEAHERCTMHRNFSDAYTTPWFLNTAPARSPSAFVATRPFDRPKLHPLLDSDWNKASKNCLATGEPMNRKSSPPIATSAPSVEKFLKMGHANPCWCTHVSEAISSVTSECKKSTKAVCGESNDASIQTSIFPEATHGEESEEVQDSSIENLDNRDFGAFCSGNLEDGSSDFELESVVEFRDITASLQAAFSLNHDHNDSDGEDAWTIVSAGDHRYKKPQLPSCNLLDTLSEPDIKSLHSLPSSWTLPTFDFESD